MLGKCSERTICRCLLSTALVLNATPGVDMLFTLSRTLQHGWRTGMAAALGITAGCVVHTVAAALGLAALLATSALAFTAIKWLGAAYLLWLAWGMLRASVHDSAPHSQCRREHQSTRVFAQGFLTNVLNPKVALFFLALLPQFISADAPDKTLSFLFLGAVFIVGGALFLSRAGRACASDAGVGCKPSDAACAQRDRRGTVCCAGRPTRAG